MKRLLTLMLCASCINAQAQIEFPFPYNPDSDNNGWISLPDLLSLLVVYNTEFEQEYWQTDSLSAHVDLQTNLSYFECINACNHLPGAWRMTSADEFGRGLDVISSANEYWISSNKALGSGNIQSARISGRIETYSSIAGEQPKGCMCYIRANTLGVPEVITDYASSEVVELFELVDSISAEVLSNQGSLDVIFEHLAQTDSLLSAADSGSTSSVQAAISHATMNCIDFGLHSECSPQGGFCDYVSNQPTSEGRFPVTSSCETTYNPNQCVEPNWRKFRIEAPGIGLADKLNCLYVNDGYVGSGGNNYPSRFNEASIPFTAISDDVIEFYAGHSLSLSGFSGLGVSCGNYYSWCQAHHPMSVVIDGHHYFLPFGIRF